MRHYYAAQSPRGFANEVTVHRFEGRATRDAWVDEHRDDGDTNSAVLGARTITARDARAMLASRPDRHNTLIIHDADGDINPYATA